MAAEIKHVRTPSLDIAYEESGPAAGTPVILLHGFPYDPRAYDGVVPLLTGCPPARCARVSRPRSAMI